jgi:hypothetical protein
MQENASLFAKSVSPVKQAAITFAGVVVISLLGKAVAASDGLAVSDRFPWMAAASFMLVFALFNAVYSVSSDDMVKYYGRSVYSFMGLAAASGLFAWLLSAKSLSEAGSYRWIYLVITVGYIVFLCMMAFMKKIVEFAQKEEWNAPKTRDRRRK